MEKSDFITKFYNLEGDLVWERKKNFFQLLNAQAVPLTEDDLKNLSPRTHLEKLFEIDVFIHFKIYSKLLNVIKEGNDVFICKILKHPLILKNVIGDISPEKFVNDFLPCTSYATRMKILKKMCYVLDESQTDEIFDCVHKRYGFYIAIKILHTCSSNKIKEVLSNHEVILKQRQIKFIFDKDPELLVIYLNHYKTSTQKVYYHKSLCKYIALKNPEIWFKLQKEQLIKIVRLGRRTSKNFINCASEFHSNVKYYSDFLKLDVLVRKLHGHFRDVYFEFFPRKMNDLSMHNFCQTLLRYYPKKKQWDLFEQTFMKVFQSTILDNLLYLHYDYLPFFPQRSIKNKWAEVHYDENQSINYLEYCDPNKAIPLIKDKINVTANSYERTTLVKLLLKNCAENEDITSLEAILKYICFRHRNEDSLSSILLEIKSFKWEELNENHWNYVNEIIKVLRLKKTLQLYTINEFIPKYIGYLFLRGKPFKEELISYIKDIDTNNGWFEIRLKNVLVVKEILTQIITICPDVIELSPNWKEKFIIEIVEFNERKTVYNIDLSSFPHLLTYLNSIINKDAQLDRREKDLVKTIIKYNLKFPERPVVKIEEAQILKLFKNNKENFYFTDIVKMMITKRNRSKFENDILHFFWENLLDNSYNPLRTRIIHWFFINEPNIVIPYVDTILETSRVCIKSSAVKLLSHLDLDKKIVGYCTGKFELIDNFIKMIREKQTVAGDGSPDTDKKIAEKLRETINSNIDTNLIEILSVLLPTEKYIQIVENFLPIKERLNIKDEAPNEIYSVQCLLANNLKNLQDPVVVLPTLMKFCLGDYLQSTLPALYSICYRAPENILYAYMDILSKRAVSVKKHALFLSCELLNFNYVLSKLHEATSTNIKSQKHVFTATLKYFCKNPSDELLNLLAHSLNTIDKNDEETLKSLIKSRIPRKYTSWYIQKCWYFFEQIREKEVRVDEYLNPLLNQIITSKDIFELLPESFCKYIISQYFKETPERDYCLNKINQFVCIVLRHQKSEEIYNFVFDIVSGFHKNQTIEKFFSTFYDLAIKDIKDNDKIDLNNNYHIELFKQHWVKRFTPIKMFDEHVLLDLLYLKSKSSGCIKSYAQEVVIYLDALVAKYGPYIYNKFKGLVNRDLSTVQEMHSLFYNILEIKNSTLNCMLVLDSLERDCPQDDGSKEKYYKIIEILKNSTDPVVSVYFNSNFGHHA